MRHRKAEDALDPTAAGWRRRLHEVIFEADTSAGLAFDVVLLVAISASVLVVLLASVEAIRVEYGAVLYGLEWVFTILFSAEYLARLISVRRPLRYATSFFGVVDLLSILPTFLSVFVTNAESLLVVRTLRMVRIFRIFKLSPYLVEGHLLAEALRRSRQKIVVFLTTVLASVVVVGATMYVVEGPENGFTSIPLAIYWAIVTITTVGYGDVSPSTPLGQAIAALVMMLGYAIIAVPTGIVTVELAEASRQRPMNSQACHDCGTQGHDPDARFCKHCGGAVDAANL